MRKMIKVCVKYVAPETERLLLENEGSFCASKPVTQIKGNVEVDDWVTIENDVTFE